MSRVGSLHYKSSFKGGREDLPHSVRVQTTKMELSDFRMTLKNGFGKCSLFILSTNGWKDQNMAFSFSRQRKP